MILKRLGGKCFTCSLKKWSVDICYKQKLQINCLIKNGLREEPDVKHNLNTRKRYTVCAHLRSGPLPLALQTSGFNATPGEDRLCYVS